MWMPFAGRIVGAEPGRSSARTSSAQTPVALMTASVADVDGPPVGAHLEPGHPAGVVLAQPGHRGAVGHHRPEVDGGGAGHGQAEPGVVGPRVVVQVRRTQALTGQRREVGHGLVDRHPLVELADPGSAGEVVHPHRAAHGPRQLLVDHPVASEDRDEERQRLDEVGGVVPQALAFEQRLVDEPDVALLEVAQAAVDQLGRLRRRARREVVAFHERGAQPARCGVEGAPDPGDPSADHHHVETGLRQAAQGIGSVEGAGDHTRSLGRSSPPPCVEADAPRAAASRVRFLSAG